MSVITVQVGQCGNQIGASLFSKLAEEATASSDDFREATHEAFFRPRVQRDGAQSAELTARAVLLDMEPKVVENTLRAPLGQHWSFNQRGTLTCQSGSGNNWARGYHTYGPKYRSDVCELLRREARIVYKDAAPHNHLLVTRPSRAQAEACDHLSSVLFLQSMAGGTGAGFGSFVVESARDEYPHACVLSHCVWPYESGEVIVQNYNTLLTLDVLLESVDGLFLVENEALHAASTRLMNIARPTFDDLNRLASRSLAGAMLPGQWRSADGGPAVTRAPGAYLAATASALASDPSMRIMTLLGLPVIPERSVDFTTFTWPSLLKRLRQMLLTGSTLDEGLNWNVNPGMQQTAVCAGAVLTLRGKDCASADVSVLRERLLYSPWMPQPLTVGYSPARFCRCDMAASLVATASTAAAPAARMLERAYRMYATRAYCHQYAAHGMEAAHFDAAFAHVEDVVTAYAHLHDQCSRSVE